MRTTVGIKIGGGVALALMALAAIGGVAYRSTAQLVADARRVEDTHRVLAALDRMLDDLQDAESGERGYLITGRDRYLEPYKRAKAAHGDDLGDLRKLTADNPSQQRWLVTLEFLVEEKLGQVERNIAIRLERGAEAATLSVMSGKGKSLMTQIRTVIGDMRSLENLLLQQRSARSRASSRHALAVILWGSGLAFAGLAVGGWALTRDIARPLRTTTALAERMAGGDFSANVNPNSRSDEVGTLLRAFARMAAFQREMAEVARQIAAGNLRVRVQPLSERDTLGNAFAVMIDRLRGMTLEMASAANVMAFAANEIASATSQLTVRAAQTSKAVMETTATVQEVRQTVQVATDKARVVAESATTAMRASQGGRQSTQETIAAMNRVRQQMTVLKESMTRLGEQNQAIGQIICSVDDVAAQSNLLAVNASIEAAKAGEQGKGFAIVAQEVKTLAEQSKQATAQVRAILNEIQRATDRALAATAQGSRTVEAGLGQSKQADGSLETLAGSIASASQAATQIATASRQELIGMEQVALAMVSVKDASDHNLDSARQLDTAARNLSDLGKKLKATVEHYEV